MIPEEEAKKKMCPFTKGNCVGEECMAWKVVFKAKTENKSGLDITTEFEPTNTGYCLKLV